MPTLPRFLWRTCLRAPSCHSRPPASASHSIINFRTVSIRAISPTHSVFQSLRRQRFASQASPEHHPPDTPSPDPASNPTPASSWVVDTLAPAATRPYLRLARVDKPIGTYLLLLPCLWGVTLACPAGQLPDFALMGAMAAGAFTMRGAGCTINDLWDRDIDDKVARTVARPLASGHLTAAQALGFLGVQLSVGLAVLLSMNATTIQLSLASVPLVVAYPLMKRVTNWPQLVLGLAMNWGALVGVTAASDAACEAGLWSETLLPVMLPLYAAGVGWTLVYDTIYAHQDREDDRKLGLGSTALYFGERTKPWLSGFASLTVAGLAAAGVAAGMGPAYYGLSVAGGAAHLAWQLKTVDLNDGADCAAKFQSNKWFGALVFAGAFVDKLVGALL